jgi:ABC-type nitrate/sulfonate/bicarbonate transport system substrate-binding protein
LALAFVGGVVESIQWIEQNQEQAKRIMAKYTGVPSQYVPSYHFQKNGQVVMDDVQFWIDELMRRGDLKRSGLKSSDVATNRYNKAVAK